MHNLAAFPAQTTLWELHNGDLHVLLRIARSSNTPQVKSKRIPDQPGACTRSCLRHGIAPLNVCQRLTSLDLGFLCVLVGNL